MTKQASVTAADVQALRLRRRHPTRPRNLFEPHVCPRCGKLHQTLIGAPKEALCLSCALATRVTPPPPPPPGMKWSPRFLAFLERERLRCASSVGA
jgi:hypothetical protein